MGYSSRGCQELDMTKRPTFSLSFHLAPVGELERKIQAHLSPSAEGQRHRSTEGVCV